MTCDAVVLGGRTAGATAALLLQSSWLLVRHLERWRRGGAAPARLPALARTYAAEWRHHFGPRLQTARVVAKWALRPAAVASVFSGSPELGCPTRR